MRIKLILVFTFLLLSFTSIKAEEINWLKDLKEAKKVAQKSGKPILLDFTAKWCGPCKEMDREFWVRREVIELSKKFVCVKIDYDNNYNLRRKYAVRAIPFVALTDSWGLGLAFHRGYKPSISNQIIEKLEIAPKDFSKIIEAGELLQKKKDDLPALAKFAEFYQQKKLYYQSNEFYTRILEVEKNPEQRETLMFNVGFNYLSLTIPIEAEKMFQKIREEFPKSKNEDTLIYGDIYALVLKGRTNEASKVFEKMKLSFPRSLMLSKANQVLSDAKLAEK